MALSPQGGRVIRANDRALPLCHSAVLHKVRFLDPSAKPALSRPSWPSLVQREMSELSQASRPRRRTTGPDQTQPGFPERYTLANKDAALSDHNNGNKPACAPGA